MQTHLPYVAVVGGCNMDIGGQPYKPLLWQDSNPGSVSFTPGGVGRNIAHNLALLGQPVVLLSLFAQDAMASQLRASCTDAGIDISHCGSIAGASSSAYLFITDENGEMELAVSGMELYNHITPAYLQSKLPVVQNAAICITDTNLPAETLEYLAQNSGAPLFADAVSTTKAKKLLKILPKLHTLQLNRLEAQVLTGLPIQDDDDLPKAARALLQTGLTQVFITLGKQGVYCANAAQHCLVPPYPGPVANTTGAGDSFMAAIAWAHTKGFGLVQSAKAGQAAASINIAGQSTINPALNPKAVLAITQ